MEAIRGFSSYVSALGAALVAHNGADWCAAGRIHKTAVDQAAVIASQDLLCCVIFTINQLICYSITWMGLMRSD